MTPNRAMKRTSLPVSFSACAEKSPGGVRRQASLTYQEWYIYLFQYVGGI